MAHFRFSSKTTHLLIRHIASTPEELRSLNTFMSGTHSKHSIHTQTKRQSYVTAVLLHHISRNFFQYVISFALYLLLRQGWLLREVKWNHFIQWQRAYEINKPIVCRSRHCKLYKAVRWRHSKGSNSITSYDGLDSWIMPVTKVNSCPFGLLRSWHRIVAHLFNIDMLLVSLTISDINLDNWPSLPLGVFAVSVALLPSGMLVTNIRSMNRNNPLLCQNWTGNTLVRVSCHYGR